MPEVGTLSLRWTTRVILVIVVVLASGHRRAAITEWPMQFHPTLQYENALAARWIWFQLRSEPLSPDEQHWLDGWHGRLKASPVLEFLTALTYLGDNRERPWVASMFTSGFWLLGGLFLLDVSRRLGGGWVAERLNARK